ncbi:hypothetical protein ACMGD3_24150 [Lysinibacillus sphaericus]|uniref:hypothetical protein n=1 Tax=Lysinibacillus sphaericus TaxID=1421 RepID=UPI003F7B273B
MKEKSVNFYFKCKNWICERRSADQTTEKSFWTWFGIVGAVVVFSALLVVLLYMTGFIEGFAEDVTTGNKTKAPGGWAEGGK